MPQLMPIYWILSFLMVLFILLTMVMIYFMFNSIQLNVNCVTKGGFNLNWWW
uniref:ATP synthase F0 subunit 8 n=1 Tax=Araneae sp. MT-2014 TaxID=1560008 RepID=A0A0A0RUY0_9ARAC|nr:ATP synthase F0 subunit 8 [Araneae sp. MT-2014]